jgi:tetraacyldisaccharide 4'-kinase
MHEPAFWWREPGAATRLLASFAAAYGAVAGWRMRQLGRDAGIPVICVGNFIVGGAGKTPTALAIANLLKAAGRRPFVLTRGYGGRARGPRRVDPARDRAHDVGDEALLLARVAPVVVAADRVAGAAMARAEGADVLVMDDGFQNPALNKDVAIVVIDGRRGIGNAAVFPAGPLRAPLGVQIERAHAVLSIGALAGDHVVTEQARRRGLPVFHGRLDPDAGVLATLRGRKALAFAGIGDPEKFFATLSEAGIEIGARAPFPDHHRYGRAEADQLIGRAERQGLVLVTTEKDVVRLAGEPSVEALASRTIALPVTLVVEEQAAFRDLVLKAVG